MFGVFAAKQPRASATKVEHQPLSKKVRLYFKYYLFLPIFLLITLYGWQYLRTHEVFPINNVVVVDGAAHVDPQTVKAIAFPQVSNGFFRLNIDELQTELSTLPWVAKATVTRQWPGKIVIHFDEYQPMASWNKNELITGTAIIFAPGKQGMVNNNLPMLSGPDADAKEILAGYKNMAQMLLPLKLKITQLEVSDRFAWTVLLSNGLQVDLGTQHPVKRFQTFVQIYPEVFTQTAPKADYVDMRYDHGMAVHWLKTTTKHATSVQ